MDAKTKALLDDYKRKKKQRDKDPDKDKKEDGEKEGKEQGEIDDEADKDSEDDLHALDEFGMREDRVATAGLDAIMREYAEDLAKAPPPGKIGFMSVCSSVFVVGILVV